MRRNARSSGREQQRLRTHITHQIVHIISWQAGLDASRREGGLTSNTLYVEWTSWPGCTLLSPRVSMTHLLSNPASKSLAVRIILASNELVQMGVCKYLLIEQIGKSPQRCNATSRSKQCCCDRACTMRCVHDIQRHAISRERYPLHQFVLGFRRRLRGGLIHNVRVM